MSFDDSRVSMSSNYTSLSSSPSNSNLLMKNNFISNTLERGWTVKKEGKTYIFSKNHKNNPKYFENNYLEDFIKKGFVSNV